MKRKAQRTGLLALGVVTFVYWLGGALLFWLGWMVNGAMGGSPSTHAWIVGYVVFALTATLYNLFATFRRRPPP